MNFHQRWNHRCPWLPVEEEALKAKRAERKTWPAIAKELGRGVSAIKFRAKELGLVASSARSKPRSNPTLVILKSRLPDFYAIGWRVTGHTDTECTVEWPHESEPRWPVGA